jgi:hypothetical protein
MAIINGVVTNIGTKDGSAKKVTWAFTGADTGLPIAFSEWADRSVQMSGTWNAATVIWEGSNDGVTYLPLTDPQGNAITKTADTIEAVTEVCELARPRVSSGAVTAVTISVILRRQSGMRQ